MTILELFLLYVSQISNLFFSFMAYGSISRCVRSLPSPSYIGVLTVRAQSWQGVFGYFDKNKSNTIDGDELEQALKQYGYRDDLTTDLQELLKRKYGAGHSLSVQSLLPIVHACST